MSYIKEEVTEEVTHEKSVGMRCDVCESVTNKVDDPTWYGFRSQTYFYSSDATDSEWNTVCCPECFFKFISELLDSADDDDLDETRLDNFKGPFLQKMLDFYKELKP